ncbi:MAG: ABC transporter permease subunit [Clostridium sp.]
MKSDKLIKRLLTIFMLCTLVVFVIIPLAYLCIEAFKGSGNLHGLDALKYYISRSIESGSLSNSLKIALYTSLITVILAFIYAYGLTRCRVPFKGMFKSAAFIPLFAPTMMYAIGLIYLFGNKGVFTEFLGIDVGIYGIKGIVLSLVIFTFPQAFIVLYVSLKGTDARLYEAAETLNISSIKTFFRITLPSVKYALFSAFLITFTLSFTDFGAAKIIGGQCNILPLEIYKQILGQQNFAVGAGLTLVLLIPSMIFLIVEKVITRKGSEYVQDGKAKPLIIKANKFKDIVFTVLCSIIMLSFLSVILIVGFTSVVKYWPYDLTFTLSNYTFENSISNEGVSFLNSIIISIVTAVVGVVLIFINSYLIEKVKEMKVLRKVCYVFSMIPLAIPGLVIGISYVIFFSKGENPLNFLYGTPIILVIANLVHFYSVPFITSMTSLKKLDKEYEETAEVMDISFGKLLSKVTLPLSIDSFKENFLYLFTNSMITISAIVFLYTPAFKVATISIVNLEDIGALSSAAALSCLIIAGNIAMRVLVVIIEFIYKKIKERKGQNLCDVSTN